MAPIDRAGRGRAIITWGTVGLLALASAGCGSTLRGRVLDADTGQPIPGAQVRATWRGPCGIFWECLRMQQHVFVRISGAEVTREAETDSQGEFVLDRPGSYEKSAESIDASKCGYNTWNGHTNHSRGDRGASGPLDIRMTATPSVPPCEVTRPASAPMP